MTDHVVNSVFNSKLMYAFSQLHSLDLVVITRHVLSTTIVFVLLYTPTLSVKQYFNSDENLSET